MKVKIALYLLVLILLLVFELSHNVFTICAAIYALKISGQIRAKGCVTYMYNIV